MKRNTLRNGLLVLAVAVLAITCKQTADVAKAPLIDPPLAHLEPQAMQFEFDAAQGDSISLGSGTSIVVPPNALVDTAGHVVTGNVKLHYRELHSAKDIFLSGAPMHYDSLGQKGYMQTAGMFEVRAYQDGMELQLDSAKQLSVKMASFTEGDEYNFYSLNEQSEKWEYTGSNTPEPNPLRAQIQDSIELLTPEHPFPFTKDYFVFEMNTALDLYFNNNVRVASKYFGNKKFLAELQSFYGFDQLGLSGRATFKKWGKYYYASEMLWKKVGKLRKMPAWMKKTGRMESMKYIGGGNYKFVFAEYDWNVDRKAWKRWNMKGKLIMPLAKVMRKKPEKWQEQYDRAMVGVRNQEARLATAGLVLRSYNVSQMGWCNWDRIKKFSNPAPVLADFSWPGKKGDTPNSIPIFYFVDNQSSYVRFYQHQSAPVQLLDDPSCFFMAVVGADSVAVFDAKKYSALNIANFRSGEKPSVKFDMELMSIKDKADLGKIFKEKPEEAGR